MSRLIKQIHAVYRPIAVPAAYGGNPLIEALPPILTQEAIHEDICHLPRVAFTAERALPPHERTHCVSTIDDLIIPLPGTFEVEAALSVLIRRGYAARHPFDRRWKRKLFAIQEEMSEPLDEYQVRSKAVPAIMVTGVSGGGKTTLIENLLEMYPQVILHTRYKEQDFHVKQLVWISVNASFDASLKGLVLSLFGAVDDALGTDYRVQYENRRMSIDTMIGKFAQVVSTHRLGVLFVDEIQCLLLRGDDEAKLALSLFLKIANVCRLPIIFGGTYAAVRLFAKVARNARRICSGGYFDLALPASHKDKVWDKLILDVVWRYQWVDQPAPLDESLRETIFDLTQGILAVLIALHRSAQVFAIRNKLKTVDAKVLRKVYQSQFVPLHQAMLALQSKKRNRLELFEDLLPPRDHLESLLRPSLAEERADLIEKLLRLSRPDNTLHDAATQGAVSCQTDESGSSAPKSKKELAAADLLRRIGSNTELRALAEQAGLLEVA
jgi:hypothetical protein